MNKNHCLYRLHWACTLAVCLYCRAHRGHRHPDPGRDFTPSTPFPLLSGMETILGIMKLTKTFKPQCECHGVNGITIAFFSLREGTWSSLGLTVETYKELIVS